MPKRKFSLFEHPVRGYKLREFENSRQLFEEHPEGHKRKEVRRAKCHGRPKWCDKDHTTRFVFLDEQKKEQINQVIGRAC